MLLFFLFNIKYLRDNIVLNTYLHTYLQPNLSTYMNNSKDSEGLLSSYEVYEYLLAAEFLSDSISNSIKKNLHNCPLCTQGMTRTVHSKEDALLIESGLEALQSTPLRSLEVHNIKTSANIEQLYVDFKTSVVSYHREIGYSFTSRVRKSVYALYLFSMLKHLYAEEENKARSLIDLINTTDVDYTSIRYKVLIKVGSRIHYLLSKHNIQGLSVLKMIDCDYLYTAKHSTFISMTKALYHFPDLENEYRAHPSYAEIVNPIMKMIK